MRPPRDPNARFAELSGWLDFMVPPDIGKAPIKPKEFPVLVELAEGEAPVGRLRSRGIEVPTAYPDSSRYCTARPNADQYRDLQRTGWGGAVLRWELELPVIPRRRQPALGRGTGLHGLGRWSHATNLRHRPICAAANGRDLSQGDELQELEQIAQRDLIAVIDTGCPFAHAALADPVTDGTRVVRLWDQDDKPAFGPLPGRQPPNLRYGREVDRAALDAWIDKHRDVAGIVAEAACYRHAGYDVMTEGFGHGAAILGLLAAPVPRAARYPVERHGRIHPPTWQAANDRASRADIVFVQLPRDVMRDSSSAALGRHLLDALRYIVCCAGAATERIVVNVSDSTSRNLHDGTSIIECAMVALIDEVRQFSQGKKRLQIVVAAGNAHLEARHAQLRPQRTPAARVAQGECAPPDHVAWVRIPADCESPQFLNIRVAAAVKGLRLRLTPPFGHEPALGHPPSLEAGLGDEVAWPRKSAASVWVVLQDLAGRAASQGLIAWLPTGVLSEAQRPRGLAGIWMIECFLTEATDGAADLDVHFWISRNQQNEASVAQLRQARFVDADERYDPKRYLRRREVDPANDASPPSVIRRAGSLSGLATLPGQSGVWVVGSRIERVAQGRPGTSLYSSRGPAAGPQGRPGVDALLPTDDLRTLPGTRLAGNLSGETVRGEGTSFAAPQWARDLLDDDACWSP